MLFHQLIVLPTESTLHYLATMMSGATLEVDFARIYVEVNTSKEPMDNDANPDSIYTAYAGSGGVWYDSGTGNTSWIIPLVSDQLQRRRLELQATAPHAFYPSMYVPHLVLKTPMPPMKRRFRAFTNVISDILINSQEPLMFDAEIVRTIDLTHATDYDFYQDQASQPAPTLNVFQY